jgi:hypothetical protein
MRVARCLCRKNNKAADFVNWPKDWNQTLVRVILCLI